MTKLDFSKSKSVPSPTVTFAAEVKRIAKGKPDFFNVGGGDAAAPIHRTIVDAGIAAWSGDQVVMPYPPVAGSDDLLDAFAFFQYSQSGKNYGPDELIATVGGKECFGLAMQVLALHAPGGEVIVFKRYWPSFVSRIKKAGLVPVIVECLQNGDVDFADLERKVSAKTCAIVINNPRNPDGFVYPLESLRQIIDIADRHAPGALIVGDEVYQLNIYDPDEFIPLATIVEPERLFTLFSLSKCVRCAGLRIGLGCGPSGLIADMRALQSDGPTGVPLPLLAPATAALSSDVLRSVPTGAMAEIRRYRDRITEWAGRGPIRAIVPHGAIYSCLDIGDLIGGTIGDVKIETAHSFSAIALKYNVGVMYNDPSGDPRSIRLNLMQIEDDEYLERGLAQLGRMLADVE